MLYFKTYAPLGCCSEGGTFENPACDSLGNKSGAGRTVYSKEWCSRVSLHCSQSSETIVLKELEFPWESGDGEGKGRNLVLASTGTLLSQGEVSLISDVLQDHLAGKAGAETGMASGGQDHTLTGTDYLYRLVPLY